MPSALTRPDYAELGEKWLAEFNVTLKATRYNLSGYAITHDRQRTIVAPWPSTTRNRLYILAHEIGHIVLDHRQQRPRYVEEFEAEQFAHALLRRDGIAVPRKMTDRAKGYVRRKLTQAFVRGAQWLDPDIAAWAGSSACGVNWSTPLHKQKHFYDASLRRVRKAVGGAP